MKWFKSYLSIIKKYINFAENSRNKLVMQDNILCLLLFIMYNDDFAKADWVDRLDRAMFVDNINLFFPSRNIRQVFSTINDKPQKITHWFNANKLSLNTEITKHTFFHNPQKKITYRWDYCF